MLITDYSLFLESISPNGWGSIYLPVPKGFVDAIRTQIGEEKLIPQSQFFITLLNNIPRNTPIEKIERELQCDKIDPFILLFKQPQIQYSDNGNIIYLPIDSSLLDKWSGNIFPNLKRREDNILVLPVGIFKEDSEKYEEIKLNQGYLKTEIIGYTNLIKENGRMVEQTFLFNTGEYNAKRR